MPLPASEITRRILAVLPDAEIALTALAADDDHWEVTVTSGAFAGLNRVAQHQLVYRAIGQDMGVALHALAVKTKVPG